MPPKDCTGAAACPYAADQRRLIVALCGDLERRQPGVLEVLARHGEQLTTLAAGQERISAALGKLAEHNARQSDAVAKLTAADATRREADDRRAARLHALYRAVGVAAAGSALLALWRPAMHGLARLAEAMSRQPPPGP